MFFSRREGKKDKIEEREDEKLEFVNSSTWDSSIKTT
jgi:hypothetical protein